MSFPLQNGQPQSNGEPTFDAPWQAKAFAMAIKLYEADWYTWQQWADKLSENIAEFERKQQIKTSDDYYGVWQQTLEQMVDERVRS